MVGSPLEQLAATHSQCVGQWLELERAATSSSSRMPNAAQLLAAGSALHQSSAALVAALEQNRRPSAETSSPGVSTPANSVPSPEGHNALSLAIMSVSQLLLQAADREEELLEARKELTAVRTQSDIGLQSVPYSRTPSRGSSPGASSLGDLYGFASGLGGSPETDL